MKRIGIFGGSFDPIHNGHLIVADFAIKELNLDEIIFVPCYQSAYKDKTIKAEPHDRLAMLTLALGFPQGNKVYDDCEIRRKDLSYTIDTIKLFNKAFKKDKLFLIVGRDGVNKIDSWKNSKEIKRLIDVQFAGLNFYMPEIGISSTLIRQLLKEGKPIRYLVPKSVEDYIIENKLYK